MKNKIRQPIVTVCGHVDHGKTSVLDCLRGSCIQESEAGGITQKISFTSYPISQLKTICPLIEKSGIKLTIPGFLFIDTPGHLAFSNLRKRGGGLADLAVLVLDITEGIKPQTAEVLKILKLNKTPFLIALNKIDKISGWRYPQHTIGDHVKQKEVENNSSEKSKTPLQKSIESQPQNIKQIFDEKYYSLIGSLNSYGFDADLFYNINDFTKKIALIPCSAKTGEGIQELILMLCGLSQRYLTDKLTLGTEAKGIVLEIKKEKTTNYIEAILYDGALSKKNEIAIAGLGLENNSAECCEPIITKIRVLEEIKPLSQKFRPVENVSASTGLRMQIVSKKNLLPGMPFIEYKGNKEEIKKIFKKEISEIAPVQKQGIIVKTDSLGSLEALLMILKQSNIPVVKAGIGSVNKTDIISAKANFKIDKLNALIVGFNVSVDQDAKEIRDNIKILTDKVIYKLIEDTIEFRKQKQNEMEKQRLGGLTTLCKLKILPQYVFRNTKPAIFGVNIEYGKIIPYLNLIDQSGEKINKIKNIQSENKSVERATENMEVAISVPGVNFERQLKDAKFLYSDISASQFKNFKKNKDLLTNNEMKILQEIAEIKRKQNSGWGI